MIRHLLAATDLSASAAKAADRAFLLASSLAAELTLIHALDIDRFPLWSRLTGQHSSTEALQDQARASLNDLACAPGRKLSARIVIETGNPAQTITAWTQAREVDLLVLGAQGGGLITPHRLGATASRLLRKSPCPVLVVKQPAQHAYRHALIAIDFSPVSVNAIRLTRALAPAARLTLIHVFEVPFEGKLQFAGVSEEMIHRYRIEARAEALRQLHETAEAAGLRPDEYEVVVEHGDRVRQILNHERVCDLVVTGKHGATLSEELLLGSVTLHLLSETQADVLTVIDPRTTR